MLLLILKFVQWRRQLQIDERNRRKLTGERKHRDSSDFPFARLIIIRSFDWSAKIDIFRHHFGSAWLLFVFIPCILLIIFSIMLIVGLRKAQIRRKNLIKNRSNFESSMESSMTSMLAVVTFIFLIVNLPQGISLGFFAIGMTTGLNFMDNETFKLIITFDNLLILATFPINFAIYCSMSTQFRTTFKALFVRRTSIGCWPANGQHGQYPIGRWSASTNFRCCYNRCLLQADSHQGGGGGGKIKNIINSAAVQQNVKRSTANDKQLY